MSLSNNTFIRLREEGFMNGREKNENSFKSTVITTMKTIRQTTQTKLRGFSFRFSRAGRQPPSGMECLKMRKRKMDVKDEQTMRSKVSKSSPFDASIFLLIPFTVRYCENSIQII